MTRTLRWLTVILVVAAVTGCSQTQVYRVDPEEEIALSDKWNGKDSELVASEMVDDMLSFPWLARHYQAYERSPTVIIQQVRNKSHQHIESETFVNDLKRAMLRSGEVDFVVGGAERDDVREERLDQVENASLETQALIGEESGANYALSGSINSFVDQVEGKRVTFYQVDLKLIDMTSNREVWNGQKKLQKLQEKKRFGLY